MTDVNDPEVIRTQIATWRAEHPERPRPVPSSRADAGLDLVVRGQRVLTDAGVEALEVGIRDGRIVAVDPWGTGRPADRVIELAEDEVLLPGLVDAHVHVNEPGRTEWEGFSSATRAAAAGGVTTIVDMPLNSVPSTVNPAALAYKRLVAEPQVFVDVGFWGGAVPGNTAQLRPLHDQGVFGFKCFLLHSGVDEFAPLDPDQLAEHLRELATFDGLMIVHAEDAQTIAGAPPAHGTRYGDFLSSRPPAAENRAIAEVIEQCRRTGARAHILHLSSADALEMIAAAKADGLDLTAETCPHYLTLTAETVPDGDTAFKCCPPIREGDNQERLWQGLRAGTIDYVASDHSPCTAELKDLEHGDFGTAWGGIASVQLGLSLVWTQARRRGIDLAEVVAWLASKPADRLGLMDKGRIAPGYQADLAVFAPDEEYRVDAAALHHRNAVTPYQGQTLTGRVRRTLLAGHEVDFQHPTGRLLRAGQPAGGGAKLADFNAADAAAARELVSPCLDIPRWIEEVVSARPYPDVSAVVAQAERAAAPFTDDELDRALARHPRIGERAEGGSAEASMSRAEQDGLGVDAEVAARMAEANRRYEQRFGHVFLIRAAGRSAEEILAQLTVRLGHDPAEERLIVADQLRQIAALRLAGVLS